MNVGPAGEPARPDRGPHVRYVMLTLFAVLLALGQALFKRAALESVDRPMPFGLVTWWMVAALVLYAVATVLWVWILRSVPLSEAYPFAALGFVIVPLLASWMFGEVLDGRYVVGVVLIITGIAVTCR